MCRPKSFAFCEELITVSNIFTFIVLPLIFLSVPTNITVDLFGFITKRLAVIHLTVISMFFLEMKLKVIQSLTVATNSCVISIHFTNAFADIKRQVIHVYQEQERA